MAGDPNNIKFVRSGREHLDEHGGRTQNTTSGPLVNRSPDP
jgi:hypothetical protein